MTASRYSFHVLGPLSVVDLVAVAAMWAHSPVGAKNSQPSPFGVRMNLCERLAWFLMSSRPRWVRNVPTKCAAPRQRCA